MQVEPVKKETLTEQVMSQIADQIVSGQLAPGEKLPDERSLATMFGVTRSRIREALRALSLIGLIDIRPGGGSFVSTNESQLPRETVLWTYHREMHNFEDLYAARKLIESTVYLSCFDHRTDEVVERLRAYADELLELDIDGVSNEAFADVIDEIDAYVGAHCGNGIYDKLLQTMIILRREPSLRILSIPASRQSAILWRVKVLKAFDQNTPEHLQTALDGFYSNSIAEVTAL